VESCRNDEFCSATAKHPGRGYPEKDILKKDIRQLHCRMSKLAVLRQNILKEDIPGVWPFHFLSLNRLYQPSPLRPRSG
jgi:hypothetical protein